MTNSIIFIIDNSHSIQPYINSYTHAINGIIKIQKNENPNSVLSCVTFNDNIKYLCLNKPIRDIEREVDPEDIRPTGLTAFYDNVSAILRNMCDFYNKNIQDPPVVIILTDGDDTSSKHLTEKQTMLQVQTCKAYGWKFIFLGVSESSIKIGKYLGFDTCILYNTKENSFNDIPHTVSHFIKNTNKEHIDVDIRDLSDLITNMNL